MTEIASEMATQGMLMPPETTESHESNPPLFDTKFALVFDEFRDRRLMRQVPKGDYLVVDLTRPTHSTLINQLNPQQVEGVIDPDYPGQHTVSAAFIQGSPQSAEALQAVITSVSKILGHESGKRNKEERCGALFGTIPKIPKIPGITAESIQEALREAELVDVKILKGRDDNHPFAFEARQRKTDEREGDMISEILERKPQFITVLRDSITSIRAMNPDVSSVNDEDLLNKRIRDYRVLEDRLAQGIGLVVTYKCGTQWKVGASRPLRHCGDSACVHEAIEPRYPAPPSELRKSMPPTPNKEIILDKVCGKGGCEEHLHEKYFAEQGNVRWLTYKDIFCPSHGLEMPDSGRVWVGPGDFLPLHMRKTTSRPQSSPDHQDRP